MKREIKSPPRPKNEIHVSLVNIANIVFRNISRMKIMSGNILKHSLEPLIKVDPQTHC